MRFNAFQCNLIQFDAIQCSAIPLQFCAIRLCLCFSAFNNAFRLWGSCSHPLRGSQGFFLGVLFGGLSFPEGPLFGVSQGVRWPCPHDFLSRFLASCFRFIVFNDLSSPLFAFFGLVVLRGRLSGFASDRRPIQCSLSVRRGWACPSSDALRFLRQRW